MKKVLFFYHFTAFTNSLADVTIFRTLACFYHFVPVLITWFRKQTESHPVK